jgi:hypothetical protein
MMTLFLLDRNNILVLYFSSYGHRVLTKKKYINRRKNEINKNVKVGKVVPVLN